MILEKEKMKMIGKIIKNIDDSYGYIVDEQGENYLFSKLDILDDTEIIEGTIVKFDIEKDIILRAINISKE